MLWVYDHYKYFYSDSAGIDFCRQNLTSIVDPRVARAKAFSAVLFVLRKRPFVRGMRVKLVRLAYIRISIQILQNVTHVHLFEAVGRGK